MQIKGGGKRTVNSVLNDLIKRSNSDSRRLRLLEQSISIYKTRINAIEKAILLQKRAHLTTAKNMEAKIGKQNEQLVKMENYIKEIVKQLKRSATKSDIGDLKELVDIFNPLTSNFVTKQEVQKLLKERNK